MSTDASGTSPAVEENPRSGRAIGARVKAARKRLGLTQEQLSEKAGVGQVTISKYEIGSIGEPGAAKIADLARALGVSMEWLTTGEGEGPQVADEAA